MQYGYSPLGFLSFEAFLLWLYLCSLPPGQTILLTDTQVCYKFSKLLQRRGYCTITSNPVLRSFSKKHFWPLGYAITNNNWNNDPTEHSV